MRLLGVGIPEVPVVHCLDRQSDVPGKQAVGAVAEVPTKSCAVFPAQVIASGHRVSVGAVLGGKGGRTGLAAQGAGGWSSVCDRPYVWPASCAAVPPMAWGHRSSVAVGPVKAPAGEH